MAQEAALNLARHVAALSPMGSVPYEVHVLRQGVEPFKLSIPTALLGLSPPSLAAAPAAPGRHPALSPALEVAACEKESGVSHEGDPEKVTVREAIVVALEASCKFVKTGELIDAIKALYGTEWENKTISSAVSRMAADHDRDVYHRATDPGDGLGTGYGLGWWVTQARESQGGSAAGSE